MTRERESGEILVISILRWREGDKRFPKGKKIDLARKKSMGMYYNFYVHNLFNQVL